METKELIKALPHQIPFIFIDRVLELEQEKRCLALKNVTATEWFFLGHFPGEPVMPGVLILEAMSQAGGILFKEEKKSAFIGGFDRVRFYSPVIPGDTLLIECQLCKRFGNLGKVEVKVRVGDRLVAEGEISYAFKD